MSTDVLIAFFAMTRSRRVYVHCVRESRNFVHVSPRTWREGWREGCPRRRRAAWTTITNASRRACTRLYTRESACTHTHTHAHVRNSAFLPLARSVGHRTRGRSKINGRGGYARSLLAARQCWRTDVDRGSQTALRRMHSGASRNHQDGKTARVRTHVHVRRKARPTNATVLSTRYFGLETLNS